MPDTETLTPEQLKEIEDLAAGNIQEPGTFMFLLSRIVPLCHSLRAAWADVARFSTLADERRDLLSAERRANDELRQHVSELQVANEKLTARNVQLRKELSDFANIEQENAALRTQNQTQAESIIEFQENERSLKAQLAQAQAQLQPGPEPPPKNWPKPWWG